MDRAYIEVPGAGMHELPPLLVRSIPEDSTREDLVERAASIIETEDMIEDAPQDIIDQRKLDLALHLTDQYFGLLSHWAWGDSVLEWIRQCETTFAATSALRNLLSRDIWPSRFMTCGRNSFPASSYPCVLPIRRAEHVFHYRHCSCIRRGHRRLPDGKREDAGSGSAG
jgi:hypothetical protein